MKMNEYTLMPCEILSYVLQSEQIIEKYNSNIGNSKFCICELVNHVKI